MSDRNTCAACAVGNPEECESPRLFTEHVFDATGETIEWIIPCLTRFATPHIVGEANGEQWPSYPIEKVEDDA